MLSTGTPLADRTDTKVCLISRGTQSRPRSAFRVSARNARITLLAVSGVPTVEEKTRPWSCHNAPALIRAGAMLPERCHAAPRQRQGPPRLPGLCVTAEALRTPDIYREPLRSRPSRIEPADSDGLPPRRVGRPSHDVIPAQRPGLFGTDARQ